MLAISERERLESTHQAYENIKYHIAKKRRELGLSYPTVAMGSGIHALTVKKIEKDLSESNDVTLSSIISVCEFFKMSIQELFEMRPAVDSEETGAIADLLKKESVQPADLPEGQRADFINYLAGDKFTSSEILATWWRIQTMTNKYVDRPKLSNLLAGKLNKMEVGDFRKYNQKEHIQFYEFIRTVPDKTFELRKIKPSEQGVDELMYYQCKRVR